jgi:hypothetical protein
VVATKQQHLTVANIMLITCAVLVSDDRAVQRLVDSQIVGLQTKPRGITAGRLGMTNRMNYIDLDDFMIVQTISASPGCLLCSDSKGIYARSAVSLYVYWPARPVLFGRRAIPERRCLQQATLRQLLYMSSSSQLLVTATKRHNDTIVFLHWSPAQPRQL